MHSNCVPSSRCWSGGWSARGDRWYALQSARRDAGGASACGRILRTALRCTVSGSVAVSLLFIHGVHCASSSLGGRIGRPPSFTTMGRDMMPILRSDPEYACVYEDSKVDFQNRIGAASTYRMHLAAQNSKLRTNAAALRNAAAAGISEESTSSESRAPAVPEGGGDRIAAGARSGTHVEALMGLAAGNGEWREDVGQRYKELIPPNHPQPNKQNGSARPRVKPRVLAAEDFRKAAEAALSSSNQLSWSPPGEREAAGRERVEEAVLVLDLDKCSFWGSDGNDLGIALQWMERGSGLVRQLYRLLLNPQVKATYTRLQERAKNVRVVIYTMRATFLVYHSCFRDQTVPLRWHPDWHHRAQMFIPPSVDDAETVMQTYSMSEPLLEEEYRDLKKSFERLLATRAVLADELGLERAPDLVVTASPKDVEGTMKQLGIAVENAYLWDDNVKLRDNPRVVQVPHFDALPPAQHAALIEFLNTHCPANLLEEDLVEFMMGADPADVAIARDEASGELVYRIPMCRALGEWALPCLVRASSTIGCSHDLTCCIRLQYTVCSIAGLMTRSDSVQVQTRMFQERDVKRWAERDERAKDSPLRVLESDQEGQERTKPQHPNNGHLSPVTPEHELDVAC